MKHKALPILLAILLVFSGFPASAQGIVDPSADPNMSEHFSIETSMPDVLDAAPADSSPAAVDSTDSADSADSTAAPVTPFDASSDAPETRTDAAGYRPDLQLNKHDQKSSEHSVKINPMPTDDSLVSIRINGESLKKRRSKLLLGAKEYSFDATNNSMTRKAASFRSVGRKRALF